MTRIIHNKHTRLRKILALLLIIGVLAGVLRVLTVKPGKVFADSLFSLNEGYGTTTADTNSSVSTGTITNAVWKTEDLCKVGKCLYFDGTGDYVSYADASSLDMAASDTVTVEAWFRTPDITSGTRTLISKEEATGADGGYRIQMNSSGFLVFGIDSDNTSYPAYSVTTATAYDDNQWHHVAAVKDGISTMTLYVDGQSQGSTSIASTDASNNDPFTIGSYFDVSASNGWSGFIDEVKVLRTARTAAEVKTDYAGETPSRGVAASFGPENSWLSDGLVGYWPMDETTSNSCTGGTNDSCDKSGNGNDGAWQNNVTAANGKFGKATDLDGTDDWIDIGSSSSLDVFGAYQDFSISMWIKRDSASAATDMLFSCGVDSSSGPIFAIDNNNADALEFVSSGGSELNITSNDAVVGSTGWQHVILSADRDGDMRFFVNGVYAGGGSMSAYAASNWNRSSGVCKIGRDRAGADEFAGVLDDVRLYKRALTATEVSKLYSWAPGPVGYWNFEEGSGNANDKSGNGTTLTNQTNTTYANGKYGKGIDLKRSTGEYFSAADNSTLSITGNLTLAGWINLNEINANAVYPIAGKWENTNHSYLLSLIGDEVRMSIDSETTYETTTATNIQPNTWYHIEAVYTASSQNVDIYVNGVLQTSSTTGTIPASIGDDGSSFMVGYLASASATFRPQASADDGADNELGTYDGTNTELDGGGTSSGGYVAGTRHVGVVVPQGAIITSASYDWMNNWTGAYLTEKSRVHLEASDNASTFSSGSSPDSRTKTTAYTDWVCTASDSLTDGDWFSATTYCQPPSIKTQVQEVVNRSGWASGNSMAIIYDFHPSGTDFYWFAGKSYDQTTTNQPKMTLGWTTHFDGVLDDIKVYNYARTSAQVIEDMNAGHPAPGSPVGSAIGHWKFDEGVDNTCLGGTNDVCNSGSLGKSFDGAASNTTWTNAGKFNKGMVFNGSNSIVDLGVNTINSTLNGASAITLSSWMKVASYPGAASRARMISIHRADSQSGAVLSIYDTDQIEAGGRSDATDGFQTAAVSISNSTSWHHVVGILDFANDQIRLYLDGTLVKTQSVTFNSASYTAGTPTNNYDTFGSYKTTVTGDFFNGTMDETKIYPFALTADQIKAEYNQGSNTVMGALSTDSSGNPSWSANDAYCPSGQGTSCTPPVAHWKLDENTGQTAYDVSGNGISGTLGSSGSADSRDPKYVAGKYGSGMVFDGVDDWVDAGTSSSLAFTGDFTLEAWVYPKDDGRIHIAARQSYGASGYGFMIWDYVLNPMIYAGFQYDQVGTAIITPNRWHHTAMVKSGTSVTVYLDGVAEALPDTPSSTVTPGTNTFYIGQDGADDNVMDGVIDDVKAYNYARTPAQIAWDYNRGAPAGWWKMDESSWNGTSGEVKDSSGNGLHGVRSGDATTTTGKYNNAGTFDGTGDFVTVADPGTGSVLDFTSGETITLTAWINPTSMPASNEYDTILSKNDGAWDGLYVQYKGTGNLEFCQFGTVDRCFQTTGTPVTTGSWQYIVFTHTFGTPSSTIFYHNGQPYTGAWEGDPDPSPFSDNSPVIIGADGFGAGEDLYGLIDDVRLYRYALTSQQMKLIQNEGALRFGPASGSP